MLGIPVLITYLTSLADLQLYDGCGNIVEQWAIEHCYPLNVDFGELDMNSSDVVVEK